MEMVIFIFSTHARTMVAIFSGAFKINYEFLCCTFNIQHSMILDIIIALHRASAFGNEWMPRNMDETNRTNMKRLKRLFNSAVSMGTRRVCAVAVLLCLW